MTNFSSSEVEFSQSKKPPFSGSHLGSMRNLTPATNGAACRGSSLTAKDQRLFEFVDLETGEILICDHLADGSIKAEYDPVAIRLERWVLQSAIRHLLPDKRVSKCCRLRAKGSETINVMYNSVLKAAHYGGHQTCCSVWDCPICAAKISERRRMDEVKPAMDAWKSQGCECLMLTLTNPHFIHTVLSDLLKGQQKSMKAFVGSRAYRRLMAEMGCIGTIRAWECTHGVNGFHPHFHIILFTKAGLDLAMLEDQFYSFWSNACRLAKLPIPDRSHGVSLQDGDKADGYLAKGGWGLDYEITKAHLKKSTKGRSPLDLIRSYVFDGDKQSAALFIDYSRAFHGKRQLYWSPGLKDYFNIDEITDDVIAVEQDQDAILLGRIEWPVWQLVLKSELRGEILEIARSGSWDAVLRLLDSLVVSSSVSCSEVSL